MSKQTLSMSVHIWQLAVSHLWMDSPGLLKLHSLQSLKSNYSWRKCPPPGSIVDKEKKELWDPACLPSIPLFISQNKPQSQLTAIPAIHPCYSGSYSSDRQKTQENTLELPSKQTPQKVQMKR